MQGYVVKSQSGFFTVETEQGPFVCQLRGRLKKGRRAGDVVAVGDCVEVTPLDGETGMIVEVKPRRHMFARLAPNPQGEYLQILIANPDQVVLVFACDQPAPRLGMLDRFLVIAEKQGVPAMIVANKVDLVGLEQAQNIFDHYRPLGYGIVYASALSGLGIAELCHRLIQKVSLFTGPSGVGKSSLLNAVQPGLGLQVNRVSHATRKGRHTTVVREMFPLG